MRKKTFNVCKYKFAPTTATGIMIVEILVNIRYRLLKKIHV